MIDIGKAFQDQFQGFGQDFKQGKEDGANLEPCRSDKHEYVSGYSIGMEGNKDANRNTRQDI